VVESEHRASDVAADGVAVAVSSSVKLSVRRASCRTIAGAARTNCAAAIGRETICVARGLLRAGKSSIET